MVRTSGGAQIFTLLAHEMAHIWAGQGGLSNPDYGLRSEWEDSTVEQFCNRVAAETLVPGEDFRSRWSPDLPSLSDHLRDLSRHYKVSIRGIFSPPILLQTQEKGSSQQA